MKTSILCTLFAAGLMGCASEPRPTAAAPQLTSAERPAMQGAGWPALGQGNARFIRIDLGPDTFNECIRVSPKFPFDSASTYAQDREQLVALAQCLNSLGMRDRSVRLVGRADPAGTDAYNEQLGMKRANAIRQILIDNGIGESRIEVVTEGARDAKGDTPDQSSGYDRRVDVVIEGGRHVP
jgi:outer membrane protein OmpA-like peptidoglycan-associated protein